MQNEKCPKMYANELVSGATVPLDFFAYFLLHTTFTQKIDYSNWGYTDVIKQKKITINIYGAVVEEFNGCGKEKMSKNKRIQSLSL